MSDDEIEVFDEEELVDGFDEEIVDDSLVEEVLVDGDEGLGDGDEEEAVLVVAEPEVVSAADVAAAIDDEGDLDDVDVELALDEVLAETILRTGSADDEEDEVASPELTTEMGEVILPKQDDEFRCSSCRLLKKTSQLADKKKNLCRDCV